MNFGPIDTSSQDPALHFLGAVSVGTSSYIENMEAAGQRQLVNSDRLPTDSGGTDADFEAVGFTFGPPDGNDPLFRPATLPEGWKREGSDHSMGSYVVDPLGRRRVSVFYKAAFYDRRASMYLVSPAGYLNGFLWGDDPDARPVLDEEWLTPEVADAELARIRDEQLAEAKEYEGYATESTRTDANRAALRKIAFERRVRAAKTDALRLAVSS
jgi:hypothetical protein